MASVRDPPNFLFLKFGSVSWVSGAGLKMAKFGAQMRTPEPKALREPQTSIEVYSATLGRVSWVYVLGAPAH